MRRYYCEECKFSCSTELSMYVHREVAHGDPYISSSGQVYRNPVPIDTEKTNLGFEEWWDESIRLAQISLCSGDYWVSKGIAKKAWNAAKGII
jgi:hypothetical protein